MFLIQRRDRFLGGRNSSKERAIKFRVDFLKTYISGFKGEDHIVYSIMGAWPIFRFV